ncbi:hypothetical protein EOA60_10125 [Mesorhizobium sp. M1A.F.Ca.IN.020.06.1.1]|uniref:hypothetical protein n=1 Tax=unclassified Mesorhizobium TaxID=325217 RepID=UPI000FCBFF21|nr:MULTISPECIES: hypothetical protein [unclassified Mesorhizobium]RUU99692.1 hypothetical protein EOA79_21585 [Mesorhizobium sp. M1A.F.Ca.IN.020.03.2.1]RUV88809.1 hypothetical protein EOA51_05670 [Mesorhizobium sp. M1A.F.Ca.IN.020.32.1.1]RUW13172.1 hypothetical protein EOA46_07335 [Mesorhizobium sp. M1A.F.Ca.IN.022.05.2.1]RUW32100.1 hypothetical protein EOA60_10125 [Mesorhizobium sp. M1A.F.Ca.IN.020.06.1.1]RWF74072.1 MAG: hypothetical protein EOQ35_29550 [Mesorhizobium sp.]
MKRNGIEFGDPSPAVVAYIHELEGKVGELGIKVDELNVEIGDLRSGNALWLIAAGAVVLCVSYWGLHPGWKLVPFAAVLLIAGIWRYRRQQAWERRRFDAIMTSDE